MMIASIGLGELMSSPMTPALVPLIAVVSVGFLALPVFLVTLAFWANDKGWNPRERSTVTMPMLISLGVIIAGVAGFAVLGNFAPTPVTTSNIKAGIERKYDVRADALFDRNNHSYVAVSIPGNDGIYYRYTADESVDNPVLTIDPDVTEKGATVPDPETLLRH